jgi:histidine ammonia-lyase
MAAIVLDGESLRPSELWKYCLQHCEAAHLPEIRMSESALLKISQAESFVKKIIRTGEPVYGINTGFGKFAEVSIPDEKLKELQLNFVRSHSCGVGPSLTRAEILSMWIIRLNVIARGHSGVRTETLKQIIAALNRGFLAKVPSRGSVGASGDLAPSAHATLALLGEGECSIIQNGKTVNLPAADGLKALGLKPLELGPKEALSLVNGTQLSATLAIRALVEAQTLIQNANLALALSIEGLQASHSFFDTRVIEAKNQQGTTVVGNTLAKLLNGPSEIREGHQNCGRVQDPYSLRCAPQVHGAVWDELEQVSEILAREINSSTDNPLLFSDGEKSLSGGNFHAIYPARCADRIASAITTLASISERRTAQAISFEGNRLFPFLVKEGGLNSGFMMAHVTSAALVSECKSLCFPASVDSIPTSDDREDHVSMGPGAGFKACEITEKASYVLGIEMLCAAQAIDFLRPKKSTQKIESAHHRIRSSVPFLEKDRNLSIDIDVAAQMVRQGVLL